MSSIPEVLAVAYQYYQGGHLAQTEVICHKILQQQPDCFEALRLLGIMAHQVGKLQEAVTYYQQLVVLQPDNAETHYSLGAALDQQGQLAQAIIHYKQAIAINPNYTDAHYDLANALKQQDDLSAAIEHYQQAVTLNPNDAEAHCNLANALLEQGQAAAAINHYHQAIALKPHVPGVYYNIGNALRQQGQFETALTNYRWALVLDPNYADAYIQIGVVFEQQGQLEEAKTYYQQALALNPNSADAYCKLASILLKQGKHGEAIYSYQCAAALEPDSLDTYLWLGCVHITEFQLEEATACFQRAISLNPNRPEAHQNLGVAFEHQSKVEEAMSCFQKALQLQPTLLEAYWQEQLLLPILYKTQAEISFWRQRFSLGLHNLIQKTALDTLEQQRYILAVLERNAFTFYLSYQGLNDRELQSQHGNLVHRVMTVNYPQWTKPLPMPQLSGTGKIRIGYISAYFREHTIGRLTLGWLKNCDRGKFEIYTYNIGHYLDSMTEQFRSYSDSFYDIYGNLESACQQIFADKLHILVFTDIGMYARTTLIAGLRLAPVQCMFWGHPITSGLPTIDYFLSSELMEPENPEAHYCEKLICLPNIGVCYEKPKMPTPTKSRSDFHLREDAVVYLSCQSLFKYLPQFDYIFAQIAQRVPQAQFVFISSHAPTITAQFQARLQEAFANLGLSMVDYCLFLPRQMHADYFNLNLMSDIFLDTWKWSGGNTTLEAIACGLPVVTCPGEFMRGRHAYGILQMMGITETIARNEAEYIEIAVRLGLDSEWRQDMVHKIYERHSWLYDDKSCVTALESFYESVV